MKGLICGLIVYGAETFGEKTGGVQKKESMLLATDTTDHWSDRRDLSYCSATDLKNGSGEAVVAYYNSEGPSREAGCVCTKTRFIDHANIRAGGNFGDEEIIYCNSVLAVIPMLGNCSGSIGG